MLIKPITSKLHSHQEKKKRKEIKPRMICQLTLKAKITQYLTEEKVLNNFNLLIRQSLPKYGLNALPRPFLEVNQILCVFTAGKQIPPLCSSASHMLTP